MSTWSSDFVSSIACVSSTLAWVLILGLNLVFYDESYLLYVARVVGHPIKVDMNTLNENRGRFARICVELDLSQVMVGKVCLEGYWYNIEYEVMHVICTKCGCYGHISRDYVNPEPEVVAVQKATAPSLSQASDGNPSRVATQLVQADPMAVTEKVGANMEFSMDSGENNGEENDARIQDKRSRRDLYF